MAKQIVHHRRRHAVSNRDFDSKHGASEVLLLLIEFFIGSLGFDRMYMGQFGLGFLKFFLFFFGLIFLVFFIPIGIMLLIIWVIWNFIDTIWVFVTAIAGWKTTPFNSKRKFVSQEDVRTSQVLGIVLAVLTVVYWVVLGATTGPNVNLAFAPDSNNKLVRNLRAKVGK
jgi:hypothetical protein